MATKEVKACSYFLNGDCQFGPQCRNPHPLSLLTPYMRKLYLKKHPPEPPEEEDSPSKKARMKTAAEVISRIMWDELLPRGLFTVGYLDRFYGVIEKPFDDFEWINPAEADYFSLSIPKHRIMYFKYKHRKVWDKQERLDMVFGSTGSPMGIDELMRKADYEEEVKCELAEDEPSTAPGPNIIVPDGPNYFACVRVQNLQVLERISELRAKLIQEVPSLEYCSTEPSKYHLTALFFRLETLGNIDTISHTLQEKSDLLFTDPLPAIQLKGIGTYGNKVVYAKVEADSVQEYDVFRQRLCSALGIATDWHFTPHVTLMKVSNTCQPQKLPSNLCTDFRDFDMGTLVLDNISLCQMSRTEGFYPVVTQVGSS